MCYHSSLDIARRRLRDRCHLCPRAAVRRVASLYLKNENPIQYHDGPPNGTPLLHGVTSFQVPARLKHFVPWNLV